MVAAFDHPWLAGLVGDAEVAALLGPEAELAAMLAFETALAAAEARAGVIPAEAAAAIAAALAGFRPDIGGARARPRRGTAWWCPSSCASSAPRSASRTRRGCISAPPART